MSIFLNILLIIGKILLGLLLIAVAVLLLVLLVPIRYRADAEGKAGDFEADFGATWFFRLLSLRIRYTRRNGEGVLSKDFRIAGVSPEERRKRRAERRAAKRKEAARKTLEEIRVKDPARYEALKEESAARRAEKQRIKDEEQAAMAREAALKAENDREAARKRRPHSPFARLVAKLLKRLSPLPSRMVSLAWRLFGKLYALPFRIASYLSRKWAGLCALIAKAASWAGFATDERTLHALRILWKHLRGILGHIKPRILKGRATAGTGDPALTGQLFGVAAAFLPVYGRNLTLTPDFMEKRFEGQLAASGRVRLMNPVAHAGMSLLHSDVRWLIGELRHRLRGSETDEEEYEAA